MESENFILSLYAVSIVLCIQAFRISSRAYDTLPARVPVHFNIKGKADKWSGKSMFSVYLLPVISSLTLAGFLGMLVFIHKETGYMPDAFNFGYWLLSFSMVYVMYRIQQGMIRYALGEIETIWPYIGPGLILMAVACILMASSVVLYKKPFIAESVLFSHIKNGEPVENKAAFSKNDHRVSIRITLKNVMGRHNVKFQWIDPYGNEHFVYSCATHHKLLAKYVPIWSYIDVSTNRDHIITGKWQVVVYVDHVNILTKTFTMVD